MMPQVDSTPPSMPSAPSAPQAFPVLNTRNGIGATHRTLPATFKTGSNSPSPPTPSRSPILDPVDSANGDSQDGAPPILNDADSQIVEALKSKDRLYVLKLGEQIESLFNDRRPRIELTPSTSYQRMLVYRCSEYYKVAPESEGGFKPIYISLTPESRIPSRKICELVPAEPTLQPTFKIMRRNIQDRRPKSQSRANSIGGEDGDLSDIEPSESGSLGGRSNATGGSNKKRMTIEEREAAYNEARSRIFMGFDEKGKDKDLSASSSTHSLVSGSASGGGDSVNNDVDDQTSVRTADSEWSRDPRRGANALRSSAPPFTANGPDSSRNSQSPSPAVQFASLHEPPPAPTAYDPAQGPGQSPGAGYMGMWYPMPPLAPGQQPPPPHYFAPYPYYPTYPWPGPQPNAALPPPDQMNPSPLDMYGPANHPPPQAVPYAHHYGWPNVHPPPFQHGQHVPPPGLHPRQGPAQQTPPPPPSSMLPPQNPHYSVPYMPSYSYPTPFYQGQPPIPPNLHMMPPPPQMHGPPYFPIEPSKQPTNGHAMDGARNNHIHGPPESRTSSRSSTGSSAATKRNAPPNRSWSHGSGTVLSQSSSSAFGDVVGPRLSSMRRPSGNSSGRSSSGNGTPAGDEASSNSSTTSSSSRRTFTSTTSSQHPLPARPDWAVGLRPSPSPSKHPRNTNNMRSMSNAQNHNQSSQSPSVLQAADFPPLSFISASTEKRPPVVAGAWTNTSSTRSVFAPHNYPQGPILAHHPLVADTGNIQTQSEEGDSGYERPPPRGAAELFNPKVPRRSGNSGKTSPQEKDRPRADVSSAEAFVGQMASLSLTNQDVNGAGSPAVPREIPTVALPT